MSSFPHRSENIRWKRSAIIATANIARIMITVITTEASISGPAEKAKKSGGMKRIVVKKKDGKSAKSGENIKNMATDMAVAMIEPVS